MARLNARQKRAKARRIALHELALARNPTTQPEKVLSKVWAGEQASVKSALNKHPVTPSSTRPPQERWEGQGSKVRSPGSRFAINGIKPGDSFEERLTPTKSVEVVQPDRQRAHLMRAWKNGRPIKPA